MLVCATSVAKNNVGREIALHIPIFEPNIWAARPELDNSGSLCIISIFNFNSKFASRLLIVDTTRKVPLGA